MDKLTTAIADTRSRFNRDLLVGVEALVRQNELLAAECEEWRARAERAEAQHQPTPVRVSPPAPLVAPPRPSWAYWWGSDEYGYYAGLKLCASVVMALRWIPPGRFLMGSPENEPGRYSDEGPQHLVTLTKGYWLAEAPCTQAEWLAVMGTEPSHFFGLDLPVEQVSWDDCQAFCVKLRARFPGLEARLPTEVEWEYACRAGTTSAYNDGSPCTELDGEDPALAKLGWFTENSESTTHPVRKLAQNEWGLFDMHGNVWEWCADWKGEYAAEEQVDPTGADTGHGRVIRGGSWNNPAGFCRSAFRLSVVPVRRDRLLGFRLASGQAEQVIQERAGKPARRRRVAAGKRKKQRKATRR